MEKIKISSIEALEILASNGKPTLKVKVFLENNLTGEFKVPLGTSTGKKEAKELRDQDEKYFFGLGVKKAIKNIEEIIKPKLIGENIFFQEKIDEILIELDGTQNKSKLGANALIGVSGACLKAAAQAKNLPLWQYLSQKYDFTPKIPGFLMNFVNGGKHSFSPLKFQEYLFIIQKEIPVLERLNLAYFVFEKLKEKIKELKVKALGVGDEGGLVLPFEDEKLPLKILKEIIETLPECFFQISPLLGLDLAASSFFEEKRYQTSIGKLTSDEMLDYLLEIIKEFKLFYLEDPFFEEDFESFKKLNLKLKEFDFSSLVVGDDLTVTSPFLIEKAGKEKAISGVIIKPNQIGTISETIEAIKIARKFDLKVILSHRSGETEDDFLADFAVGVGADFAKLGGIQRGERMVKYNRLIEIEKELNQL